MKLLLRSIALLYCLSLPVVAAEPQPIVSYQINRIEFKENGRLDSAALLECDLKKLIEKAAQPYLAESERTKQLERRAKKAPRVHYEVEVRVDKVAPVAARPPNGLGGTELGVSVFIAAQTTRPQILLCRVAGNGSLTHPTRCSRLESCGDRLAKQIADWLTYQPVPASAKSS